MSLNTTQLTTLKTAIQTEPAVATDLANGNYQNIANYFNASAGSLAWRKNVSPQEADEAPNYSTFDSILAGKRESWGFFLAFTRDFSRNKVRNWITDVWGNATAGSNAESILQAGTENATRAEVLFGGNNKTTGTVTALDRSWSGQITANDIDEALRS